MASKRKRVVVSMEDKLNAIRRVEKGETLQKVADDYNVGRVTVGDWKKNKSEIEKWCSARVTGAALKERKTMRKCDYEKVSEALFIWFTSHRERGVPISGPLLQEKALQFRKEFDEGEADFSASSGWLDRWKRRYGVRQLQICGEKLSSDVIGMKEFREKFQNLVDSESLTGDQIFNCDETGLNYKMLPEKTLAAKAEAAAPGYKHSKDRVTILACSNATANLKMELLMIGKSKNPRIFKTISKSALPVKYCNQKSAWMNSEIFKTWFFDDFVRSTEKFLMENNYPRKAILLLDNAPTHPDESELISGDIRAIFLPPNATAICQPMDQGVLEALKRNYRRILLSSLIEEIDEGRNVVEKLKKINMKDVAYWIAASWERVNADTIARSWKALLGEDNEETIHQQREKDESNTPIDDILPLLQKIPGCEDASENDVNLWLVSDEQNEVTDSEIVDMVNCETCVTDEQSGEIDAKIISHKDGLKLIEDTLTYIEQQDEASSSDIVFMMKWRNIAAKKRQASGKQLTIKNFFSKS